MLFDFSVQTNFWFLYIEYFMLHIINIPYIYPMFGIFHLPSIDTDTRGWQFDVLILHCNDTRLGDASDSLSKKNFPDMWLNPGPKAELANSLPLSSQVSLGAINWYRKSYCGAFFNKKEN